jgi:hypothetical protein
MLTLVRQGVEGEEIACRRDGLAPDEQRPGAARPVHPLDGRFGA